MSTLELRIHPPVVMLIAAAAMKLIAMVVPAQVLIPWRLPIVALFLLAGVLLPLFGALGFRRHKTTVNPHTPTQTSALVTTGVHGFSRNPMYLGLLLVLAGWAFYLANWVAVLLLPAFVLYINRYQIQPEERVLAERFGEDYAAYRKAVRRWL
jgi:protein-S-isoprenylcysteine O-methyltransferase Ste14